MPSIDAHERFDYWLFGRSYREVHEKIDEPWVDLGLWHRVAFHSFLDVFASDPEIQHVVLAHQIADLLYHPLRRYLNRKRSGGSSRWLRK